MISIALKNLLAEKTRLLISIGGIAFSVLLILVILGLYQGWQIKGTQFIRNIKTDFWVSQKGSADITNSSSLIPDSIGAQIKNIDGVASVKKFLGKPITFQVHGQTASTYVVGFEPSDPLTGPENIASGRGDVREGEILIDKILAHNKHIEIGDTLTIADKDFKVVGLTSGANMFLFQFAFLNEQEAEKLFGESGFTNFYLVRAEAGEQRQVQDQINRIGGYEALSSEDFVNKNRASIDEVFLPIIDVLVLISVLVGTAIIGLTIYTATIEKTREFGVLKALGGSNSQIYSIILEQSLLSGFLGYLLGVGMTYFLLWVVPLFVPLFVTVTRGIDLVFVYGLAIFMSAVASYVPVRRILKIDPALVFKS